MWHAIFHDNVVALIISWAFGIAGILANIYVIINSVRDCTQKHRRTTSKIHAFLIANLAACDLCGASYLATIASADIYYTKYHCSIFSCGINGSCNNVTNIWLISPSCYFARFISNLSVFMSAMITLIIAADRSVNIIAPHSKHHITLANIKKAVAFCWTLGLSVSTTVVIQSVFIINPYSFSDFSMLCSSSDINTLFFRIYAAISFIFIVFSYTSTLILYFWIFNHLRNVQRKLTCISRIAVGARVGIERRVGIVTAFLATTSGVIWLPLLILFMLEISDVQFGDPKLLSQLTIISFLLVFANASANPISYTLLTTKNLQRNSKRWV
ncbi:G-protein coupled receptor GRL101-like protein [Trichoplax sp. H2]|nr:G-protein coupled receptor GRL101-like protein [Trichoplax sp. H2]|eukprot:RDD36750.1 G-protein coupled receptor GRL101-like protein [Trichoplax sp. H2]